MSTAPTHPAITPNSSLPKGAAWGSAIDAMPSRCITLEKDEYTRCERHVSAGGFRNLSRFVAIRGRDKRQELAHDRTKLTLRALYEIEHGQHREAHSSMPSWGGVGCYLSHVQLWIEARKSKHGLFVFEGDAVPSKGTFDKVKRAMMNLRAKNIEFDQYVFGHFGAVSSAPGGVADVRKATGRLYGLTGYYISPEGAHKFLKHVYPIEVQVDSYTGYLIDTEDVQIYFSTQILVPQQNLGGTKIQTKYVKDSEINSGAHTNALGFTGEQTGLVVVCVFLILLLIGFVFMLMRVQAYKKVFEEASKKK